MTILIIIAMRKELKQKFLQPQIERSQKNCHSTLVLLKNNNQLLPLKKSGTIALIGPLADTKENMAGTWSVASKVENLFHYWQGSKKWQEMLLKCFMPKEVT